MIAQGGHYWNSGMFIFRISTLEAILKRYQPVMFRRYKKICEALRKGKKGLAEAEQIFLGFPKKIPHPILPQKEADNSIDFALMVPLTKDAKASVPVYAIPADFEWHDIGAWDALRKIHRPSQGDNICVGKVRTKDVCSSILVAEKGLELQAKSFSHVIAVATQDKLLLISDSRAQEVKKIFEAYTASLPHAKDQILECGRLDLKIDRGNVFALGVNGLSVRRKGRLIRIEAFHS